jgi:ribonucleoside-diphosphate reductase alpha chain
LKDEGVPFAPAPEDPSLCVFGFPKENPKGSTKRNDMTAIEQLENWLEWKTHWAEHSVSATVYIDENEWMEAGNWVLKHFDDISGIAFLPKDNGSYKYAPNEEITKDKYEEMQKTFPKINWAKLIRYEKEDMTTVSKQYACSGDKCEL